jgi:hypothetical protein
METSKGIGRDGNANDIGMETRNGKIEVDLSDMGAEDADGFWGG